MEQLQIVFFTGAGISAESGLQTFRDSVDGLWNNYRIEDVCTPEAWDDNPELVLGFYNQRREQCLAAEPNEAHRLIAELDKEYIVTVVTQNIDDLHERAGSTNVIHLHGEICKSRSSTNPKLIYDCKENITLGDLCEEASQIRPHVVWFGESLDEKKINESIAYTIACDICVIVGSSLQVYPANGIPSFISPESKLVLIDPNEVSQSFLDKREVFIIKEKATKGLQIFYDSLKKQMSKIQE